MARRTTAKANIPSAFRPFQQYIIEFPHGRFQVSGVAWDSRPPARAAANAGLRFIQAPSFSCPARCTGPRTSRPGTRCARTVIRPMCARTTIQRRPLQRRLRKSMSGGATAGSNLDQSCFSGREIWRGRQWRVRRMQVMASFVAPRVGIGCRVVAEGMLPLFRARQFPVTAGPPGSQMKNQSRGVRPLDTLG
jgi:hypothetical protein